LKLRGGAVFDGIVHLSGDRLVLELETATTPDDLRFTDFYRQVRDAVDRLQHATTAQELCTVTAEEVRHMTGFDRVMAYRFDRDDHGHVIAETRRPELESYLDLHYPASDIPAQARRLYTANWLRMIVDVAYRPVAIVGGDAQDEPLDLSFSVLRSVSPIHVEYLRSMGIHASMSISVVVEGRLWGMFICHHYSTRFVPYEVRTACEFLAQALSWQIGARERADRAERSGAAEAELRALVQAMSTTTHFMEALASEPELLLRLVDATGAAIVHGGTTTLFGATPSEGDVAALALRLRGDPDERAVARESLAELMPAMRRHAACASGLLAVPLVKEKGSYVLWFRPEVVQTVHWAGDPNRSISLEDGAPRLSPRGSFALWKETVRGRSLPWQPWEVDIAVDFARSLAAIELRRAEELERLNAELRTTSDKLRDADLAKDNFLATMSHELRNPLNAMLGWLRLLRSGQLPPERHEHALETVERNARQQAKLVDDLLDVSRIISGKLRLDLQPVNLLEVVETALEGVRPSADAKHLRLDTALDPRAAIIMGDAARLQQVVWNLLSNAIKFTPKGGRVRVLLTLQGSSAEIVVADNGEGIEADLLPHVFERFRQGQLGPSRTHHGLGLGLSIVRHLVELHGGTVSARSEGRDKGSAFIVRLPLSPIRKATQEIESPAPTAIQGCPPELDGLQILVVDDEADARELLRLELSRCGARVTVAASAEEALEILPALLPNVLISDIGMPGTDGYALIRAIRRLPPEQGGRTPAVALTAYARTEERARAFRAGFQAHVPKPIEIVEMFAILANLSDRLG
jgi:chemotaxis family two-component system sensor kinase Cph1